MEIKKKERERSFLEYLGVAVYILHLPLAPTKKVKLVMQAPPTDPLYDASHPDESTSNQQKKKGGKRGGKCKDSHLVFSHLP